MEFISRAGAGVIVYMRQEGRGIGLLDKLRAYNLQDRGYDTVDANLALGHQPDERDYTIAAKILDELEVGSVRLMTNNPGKIAQLEELGVRVIERVPLETTIYADNAQYLFTKAQRMHHLLDLGELPASAEKNSNGNGSH
jgi:3,4-dihydroxy 2-butanone 4-phosphate synthase/GTP cyclohydrolase II